MSGSVTIYLHEDPSMPPMNRAFSQNRLPSYAHAAATVPEKAFTWQENTSSRIYKTVVDASLKLFPDKCLSA